MNRNDRLRLAIALATCANHIPRSKRRIITHGEIDMATSRIIRSEGYDYVGPMSLADEQQSTALKAAISEQLAKHFDKVKDTLGEHEKQTKENGRITEELKSAIAKLNEDGSKIIADEKKREIETKEAILDLQQKLAEFQKGGRGNRAQEKSLGEQFIESQQLKDYVPQGMRSGKSQSHVFEVKTITSIANVGGAGIFPEYLPGVVQPNLQPLTVRDLVDNGTTNSNAIIWVQEQMFTNNAGYQGSDGSLKPQSDITYLQQNIAVTTLAHWIKASKQVLADFPQLQTLINGRLRYGLKLVEEREMLYGDGTAHHLHGLVPQATLYTEGYPTGDTKLDTLRRAMLQTTLSFYPATGICLSPFDIADIELTKDTQGRYIMGNPQSGGGVRTIWGLPVAECFSMQRGDFLVGSLKLAVTVFDREQAAILLSTEDQDNFVRNMVTILAEERLAQAVSRPAAIIYGAFKSGETG